MTTLIAYNGKEATKKKYLKRVQAHHDHDEIEKGYYWEHGKGCAVGCTIHGSSHSAYETELGIPRAIARLEDRIFEGMSNKKAKEFPVKFLESVNVGADLSKVLPKFYVTILTDKKHGVKKWGSTAGKKAIQKVSDLFQELVNGNEVTHEEWLKAKNAAAAAYAAAAAAYAAAAAAYAAAAAAYAAAAAAYAAAAAARDEHYNWMAEVLLKILRETK